MTQCPVLTPAQRQTVELIKRSEQAMMVKVMQAIRETASEVKEGLKSIPLDHPPPHFQYFMAVTHRELFVRLSGADPETHQGGDPILAAAILDSDRKFAAYYWEGKNPETTADTKPEANDFRGGD